MCDRAHPRALPAVPGDGSHPSWAFPSRVHEGSGYPASHRRTAYKVTPWPSHERPHKTPASSTCARTTKPSVPQHRGALLTPPAPYKGEGRARAVLELPSPPIASRWVPSPASKRGRERRAIASCAKRARRIDYLRGKAVSSPRSSRPARGAVRGRAASRRRPSSRRRSGPGDGRPGAKPRAGPGRSPRNRRCAIRHRSAWHR